MWENGEDQMDFRTNIINLDYNVLSNDMDKTVRCLSKQKNEEVFKTTLIIDLINHLWDQTHLFLQINFLLFSAYVIALSVYLSFEDRTLPYETVILACAGAFSFAEGLQIANLKQDYFKDPWNWIDIVFHPLTIAYVIARMLGTEDELVRAWISTIILLFGYLRWISYLRIFKPTRNLIQVVVTVVNDMKSFIIIIALIIIGFSFIFLVFNRGRLYGYYLYNSYGSLYGPVDDDDSSSSEKFFIALIAFLLNVILLNLLISIMGDSYAKVLEKRIKTDSLTRLDMISEATTFLRFLRRKKALNRGFLVLCESLNSTGDDDDDNAGDEWEERIAILKNLLRQSEDSAQKEMKALQHNLTRTEEKRKDNEEKLQQKVSSLEAELEKMRKEQEKAREEQEKQNEKTNEILALLTEMRQKLIGQPQNKVLQN